ncbi:MAG: hypothetical protein KDB90_17765 [Planctomycetes bacterium]|nr:hypothetical protein [Planctomycetota bacterium]
MAELFDTGAPAKASHDDLTNPRHWFIVTGQGPYQIRNITVGQTLAGEYDTKANANKMIKQIASNNPRFQFKVT